MIGENQLHNEGEGRITYLTKRINQIQEKYVGEEATRKGISATLKTKAELRQQFINDNKAPTIQENEQRESLLDLLG